MSNFGFQTFPNFASFTVNGWTHNKLGTTRGQKN
jgi:hypothetical protein